jgi:hypothetical protein
VVVVEGVRQNRHHLDSDVLHKTDASNLSTYYAFVLFSLALDFALGHRWSIGLIAVAFTYWVNYYNAFLGHPTTSVAHAWSLAVEE